MNDSSMVLQEIREIRKLLELLAEPAIAARDAKLRQSLLNIVGASAAAKSAVPLMDGSRTQADIAKQTGIHKGNLSTLVGKLGEAKLLGNNTKQPHLSITIPTNFFDSHAK